MKNVKKMVAAGTLMAAMVFGTTVTNAGIILAKEEQSSSPCGSGGGVDVGGIILAGIILAKTGIILARSDDRTSTCRNGIILAKE